MSSLQMFLPVSEPARSEALSRLQRTHHLPRHLVKAIARGEQGKRGSAVSAGIPQSQQAAASPEPARPGQQSG